MNIFHSGCLNVRPLNNNNLIEAAAVAASREIQTSEIIKIITYRIGAASRASSRSPDRSETWTCY